MSKFRKKLISSVEPAANTAGVYNAVEQLQNSTALVITSIVVCDASYNELDDTAVGTSGGYLKIKGTGFLSTATVYLNGVLITPTVTSSVELRITVPTLTVGTYSLIVFNSAAVGAIYAAGLVISGFPVWSTTTIATANLTVNTQLVATGDATLVYTLASGSLPPGVSLSSTGLLSGTISPVPSVNTVYNFTVDVKDAQNQNLAQAITFSLSVDYTIAKSLRFRSSASAYLSRTASASISTYTISMWVKRGIISGNYQYLFSYPNSGITDAYGIAYYTSTDTLYVYGGTVQQTTAVYRDPAAWYHIVLANNAGSFTLYVNGVSVKTGSVPTILSGSVINLGRYVYSGGQYYFDGEMAEVNFVDGQALAPTAFGAYSTYNQWLPKAYTGTYGTNGFYLPFNSVSTPSYAGYFIGSSNSLTTTATQIIPATGDFTIEAMINLSNLGSYPVICAQGTLGGAGRTVFYVSSAGGLLFGNDVQSVSSATGAIKVYNWYYIAVTRSGANLTLYINGVSVGTNSVTMGSIQNTTLAIGTDWGGDYFNGGYISNFRISTVVRTIAIPIAPFANDANTKFLTLQSSTAVDNSSNAYAITNNGSAVFSVQYPFSTAVFNDQSGNANHWIPPSYAGSSNNISLTAGSTYDSLTDVPTLTSTTAANYAVVNALNPKGGSTVSNGNLTEYITGITGGRGSSIAMTSGKFYCEVIIVSSNSPAGGGFTVADVGITSPSAASYILESSTSAVCYYSYNGYKYVASVASAYGTAWSAIGTYTIGMALDVDAGTLQFYLNNVGQGNITLPTKPSDGWIFIADWESSGGSAVYNWNFGQQPWTYTPPTGFLALNTYNI